MGIGKRIKEARDIKGLKQGELAKLVGVTKSAVGNYETEVSHPKEPVLYRLMSALECDANFLFQDVIDIKKGDNIPPEYRKLICKYENLDTYGKEAVDSILDKEHKRTIEQSKFNKTLEKQIDNYTLPIVARGGNDGFTSLTPEEKNAADKKHPELANKGKLPEF